MGKHEREFIEMAEKIIVKILNKKKTTVLDKKNPWFRHAVAAANQIFRDYPNLISADHLGNRYDNTSDILLKLPHEKLYLEIKMSETKSGIGTKANISQNAMTENRLFIGKVKSWSNFREEKNHDRWINNYLNQIINYPSNILKITDLATQKDKKARFLRNLAKNNNQAKNILEKIRERDREEKIEYLRYLNQQKQNKEMIKRFYILLMLGIHKKEILLELINKENFFEEIKNLIIYYANLYKNNITIKKENTGEHINQLLKNSSYLKLIFPKGVTYCKIVKVDKNKKEKPLLQIVFHWKNIAQGIKTPCLNIFDIAAK